MHRSFAGLLALLLALGSALPCEASVLSRVTGVNLKLLSPAAAVVNAVQQPTRPATTAPTPPPPPPAAPGVSDSDRQKLIDSIQNVQQSAETNASRNDSIVLTLVIAAVLLGASASIAGFCKAGILSGILSILATATVGANNVLPFREDANTYKFISAQAQVLLLSVNLDPALTQTQYETLTQKLSYLVSYGDQDPSSESPEQLNQLLQQLHSA
jgi:hypothetical protein